MINLMDDKSRNELLTELQYDAEDFANWLAHAIALNFDMSLDDKYSDRMKSCLNDIEAAISSTRYPVLIMLDWYGARLGDYLKRCGSDEET